MPAGIVYLTACPSPLATLTLLSDGENLIGLGFQGQKDFANVISANAASGQVIRNDNLPIFAATKRWLDLYFQGRCLQRTPPVPSELPLKLHGSAFRQAVWKILCEIPFGQLITYGEIARKMATELGKPKMSAQAVGGAVGHNPISIIVPCHRVVGVGGNLTGYGGGLDKKIQLLEGEGVDMSRLFLPKPKPAAMHHGLLS